MKSVRRFEDLRASYLGIINKIVENIENARTNDVDIFVLFDAGKDKETEQVEYGQDTITSDQADVYKEILRSDIDGLKKQWNALRKWARQTICDR